MRPSTDEGAVSEYEKAFRENASKDRGMPHPSGLSMEEKEKLAQEEKRLSGFKNMSIDGKLAGIILQPSNITYFL